MQLWKPYSSLVIHVVVGGRTSRRGMSYDTGNQLFGRPIMGHISTLAKLHTVFCFPSSGWTTGLTKTPLGISNVETIRW